MEESVWKIVRGFNPQKKSYSRESLLTKEQLLLPVSTNEGDREEYKYIVQRAEASCTTRPALIFVPGFLTQTDKKSLDSWTPLLVELAEKYDFEPYELHWPSSNLKKMLLLF